ncbi:MAG: hypothetical protein PW786_14535 [Arachidicoccus sp.]|nr:hypothetical protein [Arachidicoccus sp.]
MILFKNHAALTQIGTRVFILKDSDPTFIALNYFHILKWMIQNHSLHIIIDLCITVLPVVLFIRPQWNLLYLLLFFSLSLYDIIFSGGAMHHEHSLYGIIIFSLAFVFIRSYMFGSVWEGMRYVTATIYFITFCWKVLYGTVFHSTEALATVEVNLAGLLFQENHSTYASFIAFFIRHPYILQAFYTFAILIEGSFIVAFFTKKFDILLIFLGIILHLSLNEFVDVQFTVFYIMLLPFVPVKYIELLTKKSVYNFKNIQA